MKELAVDISGKDVAERASLLEKCAQTSLNSKLVGGGGERGVVLVWSLGCRRPNRRCVWWACAPRARAAAPLPLHPYLPVPPVLPVLPAPPRLPVLQPVFHAAAGISCCSPSFMLQPVV